MKNPTATLAKKRAAESAKKADAMDKLKGKAKEPAPWMKFAKKDGKK